jgi:AraC-like DNA-binding protein
MRADADWYDRGTACIPVLHQPALVRALAAEGEADAAALLAGSGLPADALDAPQRRLTPAQCLHLLAQAARLDGPEAPFTLGRHWLPGHYGAASHALQHAGSLRQALDLLVRHAARLTPLRVPHWTEAGGQVVLWWTDAVGLGAQRPFVVDLHHAAVAAMTRGLAGEPLRWTFCFNRPAPRERQHHEVHLGTALRFDCHVDAMLLPAAHLDRPWPRADAPGAAVAAVARERAAQAEAGPRRSLLGAVYTHLRDGLARQGTAPSLDDTAQHLGLSPATLKRRLAAEGTHFQAELDTVRAHLAMVLLHFGGLDNDAVARRLGFHDAPNFRRSLKRWIGQTPSGVRAMLGRDADLAADGVG